MLIKQKDDLQPTLDTLEGFLALKTLTGQQRERIEDELHYVRAGARGEKEAAYHIDFTLKNGKNWAVIHDLRLEHNGRVAQIDHLLVNRMFDLIVIESKNVQTGLRVDSNGEWEVKTRWGWKGMASPVEQNKRHIQVLTELIRDHKLTPTRLGFHIPPKFHNWVLVPPQCSLPKKRGDEATILKMDLFDRGLNEHNNQFGDVFMLAKVCTPETIQEFAQRLVAFHRPASFDYVAKFGITDAQRFSGLVQSEPDKVPSSPEKLSCERCHGPVEEKVAAFCRAHQKRFGGKIMCRTCQTAFYEPKLVPEPLTIASGSTCQECKTAVDPKVVAFCRFNSKRFNKRVLCRTCQTTSTLVVS